MECRNEYSRKYYVIFKQSSLWQQRFLKKGFGHVCIARKSDGGQYWIISDNCGGNVLTNICGMCYIENIYPNATIVPFWSIIHEKPSIRFFHINCVEIVKLVLGVRGWRIFTPYQLYRRIRNG